MLKHFSSEFKFSKASHELFAKNNDQIRTIYKSGNIVHQSVLDMMISLTALLKTYFCATVLLFEWSLHVSQRCY